MIDFHLRRSVSSSRHQSPFTVDAKLRSQAGRIVIQGPSGSGKSLLLKLISGIVRADAGYLRVGDRTLFDAQQRSICVPPRKRHIGLVFQDYSLFPHLTVAQNLEFASRQDWLNPRTRHISESTRHWCDRFGLIDFLQCYPSQLSGGQQQRVALLRAVLARPSALLLDEPFSALDLDLKYKLQQEFIKLQEELGLLMLLVTHDPLEAKYFGEDFYSMNQGSLRVGAPASLHQP